MSYESVCLDNVEPGNLCILRGPRRVGKTVAVKQTIRRLLDEGVRPTRIICVAVDGWDAKVLMTLVGNSILPVLREGETRFWFLDEVSAVSGDWAQQLKWLWDNDEQFRRDTVVLTGSNAWALTEAGGVLAGRRGRIQKQPAARSHRDGASRKAMEEHCDPSQPDIHREDVGISNQVVTRHVDYLRDAFLLWACPQRLDSTVLTEMQIGMAVRAQDARPPADSGQRRLPVLRAHTCPKRDRLRFHRPRRRGGRSQVHQSGFMEKRSRHRQRVGMGRGPCHKKHTRHGRRGHRVGGTGRNSCLLPERMTARALQFPCCRGVRLSTLGRDQFPISPES